MFRLPAILTLFVAIWWCHLLAADDDFPRLAEAVNLAAELMQSDSTFECDQEFVEGIAPSRAAAQQSLAEWKPVLKGTISKSCRDVHVRICLPDGECVYETLVVGRNQIVVYPEKREWQLVPKTVTTARDQLICVSHNFIEFSPFYLAGGGRAFVIQPIFETPPAGVTLTNSVVSQSDTGFCLEQSATSDVVAASVKCRSEFVFVDSIPVLAFSEYSEQQESGPGLATELRLEGHCSVGGVPMPQSSYRIMGPMKDGQFRYWGARILNLRDDPDDAAFSILMPTSIEIAAPWSLPANRVIDRRLLVQWIDHWERSAVTGMASTSGMETAAPTQGIPDGLHSREGLVIPQNNSASNSGPEARADTGHWSLALFAIGTVFVGLVLTRLFWSRRRA